MEKMSFHEWYIETAQKAGCLVTPANATKMIGCSRQYIEKITKQGRLTKYYYEELPFIGMNEINQLIAKRHAKKARSKKTD